MFGRREPFERFPKTIIAQYYCSAEIIRTRNPIQPRPACIFMYIYIHTNFVFVIIQLRLCDTRR